ncbi:hypothetical protein Tco_0375391 [Tanacetum coccineum]
MLDVVIPVNSHGIRIGQRSPSFYSNLLRMTAETVLNSKSSCNSLNFSLFQLSYFLDEIVLILCMRILNGRKTRRFEFDLRTIGGRLYQIAWVELAAAPGKLLLDFVMVYVVLVAGQFLIRYDIPHKLQNFCIQPLLLRGRKWGWFFLSRINDTNHVFEFSTSDGDALVDGADSEDNALISKLFAVIPEFTYRILRNPRWVLRAVALSLRFSAITNYAEDYQGKSGVEKPVTWLGFEKGGKGFIKVGDDRHSFWVLFTQVQTAPAVLRRQVAVFMINSKKGTGIETVVYADSDHAGDYVDRKSTSGICTFVGCCLTSWFSKKQTALAISTIEAEYVSARKACQKTLWMKQALIDYDVRLDDVPIMCDNKGMIDLSKNPMQHSRTKHIKIRHHFLRDNVQKGHISIEIVPSVDNIADILMKPLKRESFNYLRLGLGIMEHIP